MLRKHDKKKIIIEKQVLMSRERNQNSKKQEIN